MARRSIPIGVLAIAAVLALSGCRKSQPKVTMARYEHSDPVVAYMLKWQPERNYRPGFAADGAEAEPSLAQTIAFYGDLARVKDLVLKGSYSDARQVLLGMQRGNLPLERDNIRRMIAIIDRKLEGRPKQ
jgi:hypothetical protein